MTGKNMIPVTVKYKFPDYHPQGRDVIHKTRLIAFAALTIAACQREAPPAVAPEMRTPAPIQPTAAPDAIETTMAQAGVQPPAAGLDTKAFAGKFNGTLPCADCPGIQETLILNADGRFELIDIYQERPASTQIWHGTWSSEADGKRIRLDPNSKTEKDRLYAIDGNNMLIALDSNGRGIVGDSNYRLRRSK